MFRTARKTVVTLAALGALALGGSAVAGAAQSGSSTRRAPRPRPRGWGSRPTAAGTSAPTARPSRR